MTLANRVAVITGATGGLGRVAAAEFGRAGARLALVSTNPGKLDALATELNLPPEKVLTFAADLRQPDAARHTFQAAVDKFGRLDILLHLVGGWTGGKTLVEADLHELSDMLSQHATTTLDVIQAFVPHFQANGWGRVIVVSSPSAGLPPAKGGLYAAAKAAEEALILGLAQEIKGSGVTANVLRVRSIDVEHQRERQPSKENASWTSPEEIAAAILYLCSDAAGVINGARIPLNGTP